MKQEGEYYCIAFKPIHISITKQTNISHEKGREAKQMPIRIYNYLTYYKAYLNTYIPTAESDCKNVFMMKNKPLG